jgi:2-oxoglutarate dehydrogenase E2 component (dihydrolipoamide succinyltransferase)
MDILIPSPGESITEVVVAAWLKADGAQVEADEEVLELESEKATLVVAAPVAGVLHVLVPAGSTAQVGQLAARVEARDGALAPAAARLSVDPREVAREVAREFAPAAPAPLAAVQALEAHALSPAARKLAQEKGLDPARLSGTGKDGRITKADVLAAPAAAPAPPAPVAAASASVPTAAAPGAGPRTETRSPLSPLRQKLGQRLVAARNQTAMLTTFNEVDMSAVKALRASWRERFREVHGVDLGILSFFAAAAVRALTEHPQVNSRLEDDELVEPGYVDLGIAVSAWVSKAWRRRSPGWRDAPGKTASASTR